MSHREVMQQALQALEAMTTARCGGDDGTDISPINDAYDKAGAAITTLRAALAEPEPRNQCGETCERSKLCAVCAKRLAEPQEPVGEVVSIEFHEEFGAEAIVSLHQAVELGAKLYTHPAPQHQSLTEEPVAPELEYGGTNFGFTFAGITLTDGDKRLAALLTNALGNDHPAFADLVALFFAARGRAALAEPTCNDDLQVEPVAKVELMTTGGNAGLATRIVEIDDHLRERLRPGQMLYTHPAPQRQPLTEEEMQTIYREFMLYQDGLTPSGLQRVARAIAKAKGEKQ